MLYNYCTPTASGKIDSSKPYFIFYNIFSGRLRTYAYLNRNVTGGNTTLWEVSFDGQNKLSNDFDSLIVAYNGGESVNTMQYVSNLTRIPAKSLSLGWNCFDTDLAVYDPDIANKITTISISPFDVVDMKFTGESSIDLRTEGTIMSINTNESLPVVLKSILSIGVNHGEKAIGSLLEKIGDDQADKDKTSVASILGKGANWLASKFLGRKTTSIDSSLIKMTTSGTSKFNGSLSGNIQANMPGLANLMVPGSKITSNYTLIPSYDKPLGVFYIAKTPTVKVVYKNVSFVKTNDNTPPVHGEGGAKYSRMKVYFTYGIGNEDSLEIVLNPELESKIDHYEVSTAIVGDISGFERHTNSDGRNLGISSDAKVYGGKFISEQQGTSATMVYTKEYASTVSIPNNYTEAQEYYSRYQNLVRPTMPSNVELKVSVTLYPKAPQYNPTPIVLTRTVKCNIERP